jgi:hypothetical protein
LNQDIHSFLPWEDVLERDAEASFQAEGERLDSDAALDGNIMRRGCQLCLQCEACT